MIAGYFESLIRLFHAHPRVAPVRHLSNRRTLRYLHQADVGGVEADQGCHAGERDKAGEAKVVSIGAGAGGSQVECLQGGQRGQRQSRGDLVRFESMSCKSPGSSSQPQQGMVAFPAPPPVLAVSVVVGLTVTVAGLTGGDDGRRNEIAPFNFGMILRA